MMKFFPTTGSKKNTGMGLMLEYGNHLAGHAAYLAFLPYLELFMELMGMSAKDKEVLRQKPTFELIMSGFKTGVEGSIFLELEAISVLDSWISSKADFSADKEVVKQKWTRGTLAIDLPGFIRSPLQALNDFCPKTPEESMKKLGMAIASFALLTLAAATSPLAAFALEMFFVAGATLMVVTAIMTPVLAMLGGIVDSVIGTACDSSFVPAEENDRSMAI